MRFFASTGLQYAGSFGFAPGQGGEVVAPRAVAFPGVAPQPQAHVEQREREHENPQRSHEEKQVERAPGSGRENHEHHHGQQRGKEHDGAHFLPAAAITRGRRGNAQAFHGSSFRERALLAAHPSGGPDSWRTVIHSFGTTTHFSRKEPAGLVDNSLACG